MIDLDEQHFVALPSQSSIYGLTILRGSTTRTALVASLRQRPSTYLVSVEYVDEVLDTAIKTDNPTTFINKVNPVSKEIHFTYIPGGAEIISIDSFNKSSVGNDFVVGITFSKPGEPNAMQYFNIYTDWEETSSLSLESFAQSCISLKLNFIPYHLYHTKIGLKAANVNPEIGFLLSGSDGQIHLYREDTNQHTYCDYNVDEIFPEFVNLNRIVLWMDVTYYGNQNNKRLAVVGCEDGFVRATTTHIDETKAEIMNIWDVKHDSPISRVSIFTVNVTTLAEPDFLNQNKNTDDVESDCPSSEHNDLQAMHLLVTSTLELAVVYWNVIDVGLTDLRQLPCSDQFDCVQCACVVDIDMDGQNEIILGTYGQEILIYKCSMAGEFTIIKQKSLAYPLLSIDYVDITGDGVNELIVLSTKGLHILQHNLNALADLLMERLETLGYKSQVDNSFGSHI